MRVDEFTNREEFQVRGLTETINRLPYMPGKISRSGLFLEDGITKTYIQIEYRENQIKIIPTKPRGASGTRPDEKPRGKVTIDASHLPQEDHLDADEIQNIATFGDDSELDAIQTTVNEKLGDMRANIDVTHEYQRIGAINGVVFDADGEPPIWDLFDRFKIQKTQHDVDFTPGKLKVSILKAKQKSEDRLGGFGATGWWALCGREFMYALLENADFNAAYERYNQGTVLREDNRMGINYCDVLWETYNGHVNNVPFIPDNEAQLIPLGLRRLFVTKFAPANYNETVNTPGLPYSTKQEVSRFGKGIDFEAQSNPIHLCLMPNVIVHLSIGQTAELTGETLEATRLADAITQSVDASQEPEASTPKQSTLSKPSKSAKTKNSKTRRTRRNSNLLSRKKISRQLRKRLSITCPILHSALTILLSTKIRHKHRLMK